MLPSNDYTVYESNAQPTKLIWHVLFRGYLNQLVQALLDCLDLNDSIEQDNIRI